MPELETVQKTDAQTLIPPQQEIEKLYQYALAGNIRKIHQHAAELLIMDARHGAFVERLDRLAQQFQTKAIVSLIEDHLDRKRAS